MAKRDPEKTARNKEILEIKDKLRDLVPTVCAQTGYATEATINAKLGSKSDQFIDLKHEVINSSEEFTGLWLQRLKAEADIDRLYPNAIDELWATLKASKAFQEYLLLFLKRSYLKHYEELSKARPFTDEAELWIGQNAAHWGLLITPRFNNGEWENDESEIRHFNRLRKFATRRFEGTTCRVMRPRSYTICGRRKIGSGEFPQPVKPRYWSIGHVMATGLVVPGINAKQTFTTVEDYLAFFENVLVRANKSAYGDGIAERYSAYVRKANKPEDVPLLIPELRYGGKEAKHEYRLDFCTIDVDTNTRVGFELSPWSSHGLLTGTKAKTQKAINEEAAENFAKEARKCRDYFRKQGIAVLIYTDKELSNLDTVFKEIAKYLKPKAAPRQLALSILRGFFK